MERKLLTILSADVAEYSRLMAQDEERTLRVFREHKQVFESLVAMHRGRVFNTAGDAILAEFPSAVEAVRCATEIQAALRTCNDQLPPPAQVRFRIGVNLGDVMVHGSDLMGDGVNVAARLQAAAEPGGICISGSVHDQIRNKLSLTFTSLGERSFKNIPQPVRTFAVSEIEGVGVLPAPHARKRSPAHRYGWAAAAVVLLIVGGVYMIEDDRVKAEQARVLAAAEAAKQETAARQARLLAERQATERQAAEVEAQRRAEAEQRLAAAQEAVRQAAETARREAEAAAQRVAAEREQLAAERRRLAEESRRAADEVRAKAAAATAAVQSLQQTSVPNTSVDGRYAGPVCLGPLEPEAAFCFRAEGNVVSGKISADWSGREGRSNALRGAITGAGEVVMRWVTRRPDGTIYGAVDLEGTLRDGQLEANGKYPTSGRTARFQWRKE